ncbi:MAG TPA: hypothetical protein PKK60_01600 [archaeon]|nr:hypothetical protein [archaeon]
MKKIVFIEAEGVLLPYNNYNPNERRVKTFFEDLSNYCEKNKILLYVISGYHESVAHKKFEESFLKNVFNKNNFVCADEDYILQKAKDDETLHRQKLETDPEFNDSYFKQVFIQKILKEKNISASDALLLGDDIWVDGYYTTRFSKIDFAIFEENVSDRGKSVERISGLAYFSLEFDSVKQLIEIFPAVDLSPLDKYVFEIMKKALVGDNLGSIIKKGLDKKNQKGS